MSKISDIKNFKGIIKISLIPNNFGNFRIKSAGIEIFYLKLQIGLVVQTQFDVLGRHVTVTVKNFLKNVHFLRKSVVGDNDMQVQSRATQPESEGPVGPVWPDLQKISWGWVGTMQFSAQKKFAKKITKNCKLQNDETLHKMSGRAVKFDIFWLPVLA